MKTKQIADVCAEIRLHLGEIESKWAEIQIITARLNRKLDKIAPLCGEIEKDDPQALRKEDVLKMTFREFTAEITRRKWVTRNIPFLSMCRFPIPTTMGFEWRRLGCATMGDIPMREFVDLSKHDWSYFRRMGTGAVAALEKSLARCGIETLP